MAGQFCRCLGGCQSVLGDGKATQGIDNALNALNEAIENLVHRYTDTKYELIVEEAMIMKCRKQK